MKNKILSFVVITLALLGSLVFTRAEVASAQSPTSPSCTTTLPSNKATVSISYTVASQASYNVWSRIQGTGSGFIQVDDQCPVLLGNVVDWTWVNYQRDDSNKRIEYALTAGQHTVKYVVDSGNFNVDRVILVDDVNCIPTGLGTNCDGSPSDPNKPGSPTFTCLGSCPTMTPTLTPTQAPASSQPCNPGPGFGNRGGGGFLGFLLEFIFRLLQLLFGGSSGPIGCQPTNPTPSTPPAAPVVSASPTATLIPTKQPAPTASATATPTPTVTPTIEPTRVASTTPSISVSPSDGPCIQSVIEQNSRRDDRQERRGFFRAIFDFFIRLFELILRGRPAPQQPGPTPTNAPALTDTPALTTNPSAPTGGPTNKPTTTTTPAPCVTASPTVSTAPSTTLSPTITVTPSTKVSPTLFVPPYPSI